jgi:hypothetical protein
MANTITQRTLMGAGKDKNVIRLIHIASDGSEETDLIVYDNSAFVNDTSKGNLRKVWLSGNDCVVRLEWDQTTDSPAFAGNPSNGGFWDFTCFGGIGNPNGTGATGDLLLTTASLDAGDEVFIIIHLTQN